MERQNFGGGIQASKHAQCLSTKARTPTYPAGSWLLRGCQLPFAIMTNGWPPNHSSSRVHVPGPTIFQFEPENGIITLYTFCTILTNFKFCTPFFPAVHADKIWGTRLQASSPDIHEFGSESNSRILYIFCAILYNYLLYTRIKFGGAGSM